MELDRVISPGLVGWCVSIPVNRCKPSEPVSASKASLDLHKERDGQKFMMETSGGKTIIIK